MLQLALDTAGKGTGQGIGILMLLLAAMFFWDSGKKK